ncbi:hypothetical protein ACJX0J_028116, partial [Zea mays]
LLMPKGGFPFGYLGIPMHYRNLVMFMLSFFETKGVQNNCLLGKWTVYGRIYLGTNTSNPTNSLQIRFWEDTIAHTHLSTWRDEEVKNVCFVIRMNLYNTFKNLIITGVAALFLRTGLRFEEDKEGMITHVKF